MFESDDAEPGILKSDLIFASRRTADELHMLNKVAPVAYHAVNHYHFLDDFRSNNRHLAKVSLVGALNNF